MTVTRRSSALVWLLLVGLAITAAAAPAAEAEAVLANIPEWHGIALWNQHCLASTLVEQMVTKGKGKGGAQLRFTMNLTSNQRLQLEELLLTRAMSAAMEEPADSPGRFFERLETTLHEGLPGILTKAQIARFEELLCQIEGLAILRQRTYAERIGLSDEQRRRINALIDDYREKARQRHGAIFTARSFDEARPHVNVLKSLASELDAKILEQLTDKQRVSWIGMTGEHFQWDDVIGSSDAIADP